MQSAPWTEWWGSIVFSVRTWQSSSYAQQSILGKSISFLHSLEISQWKKVLVHPAAWEWCKRTRMPIGHYFGLKSPPRGHFQSFWPAAGISQTSLALWTLEDVQGQIQHWEALSWLVINQRINDDQTDSQLHKCFAGHKIPSPTLAPPTFISVLA